MPKNRKSLNETAKELLTSALGLSPAKRIDRHEEFAEASTVEILPVSEETADYYSRLFNDLKKQRRPIPTNDLWIAAQTQERGAVLATCDRHFQNIPNLRLDA